jgi:hypothetical protein
MEDAFEEREKSYEAKFKLDQEQRFKVQARRDKLFGLWAAERLGKTGAAAEAYAKEVVVVDLDKPGDEDVVQKVLKDFAGAGVAVAAEEIRKRLAEFDAVALAQVAKEFPEALGPDHTPVGG